MGQYYLLANLDKEQYIHPHHCGDWAKLMEFTSSGCGMLACLAILLADGNGRGGGDLGRYDPATGKYEDCDDPIIGSWAGDRIVLCGDYSDADKWIPTSTPDEPRRNLYDHAGEHFTDVSAVVVRAICRDSYMRERFAQNFRSYEGGLNAVLIEAEKPMRRKRRKRAA
jgi:hypothetical protein